MNKDNTQLEFKVGDLVMIKGDSRIGVIKKLGPKRSLIKLEFSTLACDTSDIYLPWFVRQWNSLITKGT